LASKPTIYIVCSDRHRNGKTLLARVLVDYLMLDGKDPFIIDATFPEGPLRAAFPGRTALVDFSQIQGQMKVFDTILGSSGRDYVIDLPAPKTEYFFKTLKELDFQSEALKAGFQIVVLFVVDKEYASLNAAEDIRTLVAPSLLVNVRNQHVGSILDQQAYGLTLDMPVLDRDIVPLIEDKRFSLRAFILGDVSSLPERYHTKLRIFLHAMMTALREIQPAISLAKLQG
jgi:hypothetical protein